MSIPNPAALEFLSTRRSTPPKLMSLPVPSAEELAPLLQAAVRVPDHGKLEPWRLIVLSRPAMVRMADLAEARAVERGGDAEMIAKGRGQYDQGHLAVVVVASPKENPKIPASEQLLSAGCVCLSLVNAAIAAGWGACWLSGWPNHDRTFVERAYGLAAHETVAGIIHIGTPTTPVADRPRPDLGALTQWLAE